LNIRAKEINNKIRGSLFACKKDKNFGKDKFSHPLSKKIVVEGYYAVAKSGIEKRVTGKFINLEDYKKEIERRFLDEN